MHNARPFDRSRMSASTVAMFDILVDGEWHETSALQREGALALIAADFDEAVRIGERLLTRKADASVDPYVYAMSGGNEQARNNLMIAVRRGRLTRRGTQLRMYADAKRAWEIASEDGGEDLTVIPKGHDATKIRTFGGITETMAFEAVPVRTQDRVIFRTNFEIPIETYSARLSLSWQMTQDHNNGLYRIDGPTRHGKIIEADVREWCKESGIIPSDVRVIEGVKTRDLLELPPAFLDGLVRFYQPFLTKRMRKAMTTIQAHIPDRDDQQQQIAEWVLSAIREYDEKKSVPFGAFLITRTSKKVHDLTRGRLGRTNADHQNRRRKLISEFVQAEGRTPTRPEIAEMMGKTLDEYDALSQSLDTAAKLQGATSIQGVYEDDHELQIGSEADASAPVLSDINSAAAAAAVIGSCLDETGTMDMVALGHVYYHFWQGLPKTRTAEYMRVPPQVVTAADDRVRPAIKHALACL